MHEFYFDKERAGASTGYNIKGITEGKPVYIDFEEVAAIVRVISDEKEGATQ